MSQNSIILMGNTRSDAEFTPNNLKYETRIALDRLNTNNSKMHTLAIYFNHFIGRVYVEGMIVSDPDIWFNVLPDNDPNIKSCNGESYYEYLDTDINANIFDDSLPGKNETVFCNVLGGINWLRVRVDLSHTGMPLTQDAIDQMGYIGKILLNN